MSNEEIDLDSLLPEGPMLDALRESIRQVDQKIETSALDYKFLMQMVGDVQGVPSIDVLTLIIARRYAQAMIEWDGKEMFLPILFARFSAREFTK